MTPEIQTALHAFLRLELPARESELVDRLALLHRALPASYEGWPKSAEEVFEALCDLQREGLVEKRGFEWWWIGRPAKQESKERMLFA